MNYGVGAMIHYLGGGSDESASTYYGLKITNAVLEDHSLAITFSNGKKILISDSGQSCCEHRYMSTDDQISDLIGKKLSLIEAKDADDVEAGGEVHERAFLEIRADDETVTFAFHNEHNGYYGGFGLNIAEIEVIK